MATLATALLAFLMSVPPRPSLTAVFKFVSALCGLIMVPGLLFGVRDDMQRGGGSDVLEWWMLPLLTLGVCVGGFVVGSFGRVLGNLTAFYSMGLTVGSVAAVFFVLVVPENKWIYLLGVILTIPVASFTTFVQTRRMNIKHERETSAAMLDLYLQVKKMGRDSDEAAGAETGRPLTEKPHSTVGKDRRLRMRDDQRGR